MDKSKLTPITRRAFVRNAAAGYALAAMPITAKAITTSNDNLDTSGVKFPTGKPMMPAYFAKPRSKAYFYFWEGDVFKIPDVKTIIAQVANKVPQRQVLGDLGTTVAWLKALKDVGISPLALTGFCWGGNVTWMYASHNSKLKAAAAWYGRLKGNLGPACRLV